MAEFTAITTQEQFDAAIKDRISRAEAKAAEKFSNYISPEAFKEKTDGFANQIAELNKTLEEEKGKHTESAKTIADYEAKIKAYETASVKARITAELGLPYELATRLSGDTEDAIRKDAEMLKAIVGNNKKPAPLHNPDAAQGNSKEAALLGMLREMKGDN